MVAFKKVLKFIFPWLEFNGSEYSWGSFYINRAEHLQPDGKKPNTATWFKLNNAIFAWPTKLVLAPMMANDIFGYLQKKLSLNSTESLGGSNIELLEKLPKPTIAAPWFSNI